MHSPNIGSLELVKAGIMKNVNNFNKYRAAYYLQIKHCILKSLGSGCFPGQGGGQLIGKMHK